MKKSRFVAALAAFSLAGLVSSAHARVDPTTIEYKAWPDGKKPNAVLIRAPGRLCKDFDVGDRRQFLWQLPRRGTIPASPHEGMTKAGNALLAKNNYQTDPQASGLVAREIYAVFEVALFDQSNPELVRLLKEQIIFGRMVGTGKFHIHQEDIEALPPDWKKMGLFLLRHNQLPFAIPMLIAAYDDVSDDDLRELAFEEGVTRTFCWRE